MCKSFLYKIFSVGKMPKNIKQILIDDKIIYLEEGVNFSITYINYKAPGKRFFYKKIHGIASIGFSHNFFIASTKRHLLINMRIKDEKFTQFKFHNEDDVLLITYNPSAFDDKQSGEVEIRFRVENIDFFTTFINNEVM